MTTVSLIGLDFGTTTSSAVIATAQLLRNSVKGRVELSQFRETYRSAMVFTPLSDDRLDEPRVAEYLDSWLAAGKVHAKEIFGGGALLTGLTAQRENAAALVRLVRRRVGDVLVASADDPCLESWLAFMGSCAALSRLHPATWFINLDIGGGTTNLALGKNGDVLATGCLFVGARHVQVVPGTYRVVHLSSYARRLLDHLGIAKGCGDELLSHEVHAMLDFYLHLLTAALLGQADAFDEPTARLHQQVAFQPDVPAFNWREAVVTLSGGVAELVYAAVQGKPRPSTTFFGDLGIDLAAVLLEQFPWADDFREYVPAGDGRATVYGLLRHGTQVSGSTIFLSNPGVLPLADVPILGAITDVTPDNQMRAAIELVRRTGRGGGLRVELTNPGSASVRALGTRLGQMLADAGFPRHHPLVILVSDNVGKTLGQYVTQWGKRPLNLVVIDEIDVRDGHYVHLGVPRDQVIPVSFYGLQA